jgi:hypothetical protein
MHLFTSFLSLLSLTNITLCSETPAQAPLNTSLHLQQNVPDALFNENAIYLATHSSRLIIYFQTFNDASGNSLSLLPLLNTRITHIILGAIHLHEEPGKIMLNNDPFESPMYDEIWKEVKSLQTHGIKVMGLLGGAVTGTWDRLGGSDESVHKPTHYSIGGN